MKTTYKRCIKQCEKDLKENPKDNKIYKIAFTSWKKYSEKLKKL